MHEALGLNPCTLFPNKLFGATASLCSQNGRRPILICLTVSPCPLQKILRTLEALLSWSSAVPKIISSVKKKINMSRINTVTTNEINGATHHVIIPQYPSGNQTGLFVASYCHPELGHSRPNLNKKRKNEQRLKWKQKLAMFKFTLQLTSNWDWPKPPSVPTNNIS